VRPNISFANDLECSRGFAVPLHLAYARLRLARVRRPQREAGVNPACMRPIRRRAAQLTQSQRRRAERAGLLPKPEMSILARR
jgi:hypothetical protein